MVAVAYLVVAQARAQHKGGVFVTAMPELAILEDVMYKAIALGFAFFTVATILGALWAAEAWEGIGHGILKKPGP